jgi:hypothetical protein
VNTEFTFADIRDSVTETRVEALAGFGFTERQRRFLVTVMVHSGCFLERQYCAFTGTARGQNSREFMARLVTRGFVRVIEPGPVRRGRLYHIHHKPLYEAIGQADNRNRRLRHIGRMVERVMMLDAVLGDRRCWRLSPADDKWRFFCLKRDNYLKADDYPHIAFGTGRKRTVRCFPDKLPIGIEKDDYDRLVFLYLVNRRLPVDFRQFLIRHAKLFGFVTTWTVRLLVPRRFRKAVAVYKAAVREELWTPMNPSVCTRLETYFAQCRAAGRHIADPDDRYIREEFRKQGMPKVQALYRAWRRDGDLVLWWASSTTLRDARELGRSRLEIELLNRQYLQLTGTMDRDVLERRGAKRKSRQVGPPVSTPDSDSLSPLVGDAREPQATLPDAAYFAARRQARRRSVPTRPSTLMPKSPLERWRERPRYRARHLTPGCHDGVVHAIAGRRPCPCLRARPCGRIAPPMSAICAARSDRRSVRMYAAKNRFAHEPSSSAGHDHDRCANRTAPPSRQ